MELMSFLAAFTSEVVERLLAACRSEGRLKPSGWLVRMWERIKKLAARMKKLLYAAVIVLLLCVLFYTYLKPEEIPAGRFQKTFK